MKLHSVDYKDWFINQKRIPDADSEEYRSFFNYHKELCMNGCMMDGVYINPFSILAFKRLAHRSRCYR